MDFKGNYRKHGISLYSKVLIKEKEGKNEQQFTQLIEKLLKQDYIAIA